MSASTEGTGHRSLTVSVSGLWVIGWLFTLGLADLGFGRGLLAVLLWPYYIGSTIGAMQ